MHFVYIDDSRDGQTCVLSALVIPASTWHAKLAMVQGFRNSLRTSHGIFIKKELHAWKFVSGRGHISNATISKFIRCRIFNETLSFTAQIPDARLFNAVFTPVKEGWGFERLLNRINRTMQAWDSRAVLICDHGKEVMYTGIRRRLGVFNPIPSQFGSWSSETNTQNIPVDRILEDPLFKHSHHSHFIQLADFCAYALLQRERPNPARVRYGIDKSFDLLRPILGTEANRFDPNGIIRVT